MVVVDAREFISRIGVPVKHITKETLENLLRSEVIAFADDKNRMHILNSEEYYVVDLITNVHIKNNTKQYGWGVLPSPPEGYTKMKRNNFPYKLDKLQNVFVIDRPFIGYVRREHLRDVEIGKENKQARSSVMYKGKYLTKKDKQRMIDAAFEI